MEWHHASYGECALIKTRAFDHPNRVIHIYSFPNTIPSLTTEKEMTFISILRKYSSSSCYLFGSTLVVESIHRRGCPEDDPLENRGRGFSINASRRRGQQKREFDKIQGTCMTKVCDGQG